jgi:hypothetical protein
MLTKPQSHREQFLKIYLTGQNHIRTRIKPVYVLTAKITVTGLLRLLLVLTITKGSYEKQDDLETLKKNTKK